MARIDIHIGDQVFTDWGANTIKFSEAAAIENAYGKTFAQFAKDIQAGSMYAAQVLVWSLLRRDNQSLKVGDVGDLTPSEVSIVTVDDDPAPVESDDPFANGSSETASHSSDDDADTSPTSQPT